MTGTKGGLCRNPRKFVGVDENMMLLISILSIFLSSYPKKVVDISQIQETNDLVYVIGGKRPFTGKVVEIAEIGVEGFKTEIRYEYIYKKGNLIEISRYDPKVLRSSFVFKDGHTRISKNYYQNGQLQSLTTINNKKNIREHKEYYENGQLKREKTGKWTTKEYDESGKLIESVEGDTR